MKKRFFASLLALMMLMAVLPLSAYAAEPKAASAAKDEPPYTILRNGSVVLPVDTTTIVTDWNSEGCRLDACFTSDCLLRRLRLTFAGAYGLCTSYQVLLEHDRNSTVLAATVDDSRPLWEYLSDRTYRNCQGWGGVETLNNLKDYPEYRNNATVRRIVDHTLFEIEEYDTICVRDYLHFFYSDRTLRNASVKDLLQLSSDILKTPEYHAFYNTLYGHDCSTVNALLNRGYSLEYIQQLYTARAETAVKALWPDYQERMDDYWNLYHAW